MSLLEEIRNYQPANEQEAHDREQMINFIKENPDYLERKNQVGHFTTSIWTINEEHTKTLMAYHRIYDSWAWIGGHADGEEDLRAVAMRELWEETGVSHGKLLSEEIFSLETLTVDGHVKKGAWVPSHLHFNITYLAEAKESETLRVCRDENTGVGWFTFEEALKASAEPWMVEHVYKKLLRKIR